MERIDRIKLFETALSLIENDDVRNFAEQLIVDADDYFFIESASSSGRFHPQYALGEGGLLRHSIAVALILNDILNDDCYEFTPKEKDLLICAAISHDIKKYGDNKKRTVKNHPELASKYILQEQVGNHLITKEDAEFISDAVNTHMGKWGKEMPKTDAQKLLHIADCLASKKWLEVKFDNQDVFDKCLVQEKGKPGDYIMPFGKYKGSRLSEVDPSYLDFLVNKFGYQNHPAVGEAKKLINELKKQKR